MKRSKNYLFVLGIFCVLLVSVVFVVVSLRQQTNKRSKAAPSTALSFDPATKNVNVGDTFSADITVDPGSNFVSTLVMTISFDSSKVTLSPSDVAPNGIAFSQILESPTQAQCNQSACTISFSLGTGSDPTKIITAKTRVATLTFKAVAVTADTPTTVVFTSATKVYSTSPSDTQRENVLSTTSPLTIIIGNGTPTPPVCQANVSVCQWDPVGNTSSYHVRINDTTAGTIVLEQDVQAPATSLSFPSQAGETYTCTVTAANSCGQSQPGAGTKTCPLPSPTPTVPLTPTPSACPTPQGVTNLQIICPNCNNAAQ